MLNFRTLSICAALLLAPCAAQGQAFTATWPLLNSSGQVGSATGAVTVTDELIGPGPAPALVVAGYGSTGQLVNTGTTGWNGGMDATRFLEFNVAVVPGSLMDVTNVSFDYGASTLFQFFATTAWYSTDGWQNSQPMATALIAQSSGMTTFTTPVPVVGASTFSLRIYPHTTVTMGFATFIAAHYRNVIISGTTALASSISGTKFEDLDGYGTWDPGTEPPMGGVTIQLVPANPNALTETTVTAADGTFIFENLTSGTYTLQEVEPTGFTQTAPAAGSFTITIGEGEDATGYLFGNMREAIGECLDPVPAGLVLWLSGDNHPSDLSGNGNDATLNGPASYGTGRVGNGFRLIGVGDNLTVADAPSLDFVAGQSFSFDLWFKTNYPGNTVLLAKTDPGTQVGYGVYLVAGVLTVILEDATGASTAHQSSSPPLNDGALHFASVSVSRGATTTIEIIVDGGAVESFGPSAVTGNLSNSSALTVASFTSFGPGSALVVDEIEMFDRALSADEMRLIYRAGEYGKCKTGRSPCDEKVTELLINTGFDHPAGTTYATGGNDAFWTLTDDPPGLGLSPMPAEVTNPAPSWAPAQSWVPAQSGSQWLGAYQIVPAATASGYRQGDLGAGLYVFSLEFCIIGTPADELYFDLSILVDDTAEVWMVEPDGTQHQVGSAVSGSTIPSVIGQYLSGPFSAGTYRLEVRVYNNGSPPDFSGFNLVGQIEGTNLSMQKNECCNADGKITGTKYFDTDGDGQTDGVVAGVEIQILDAAGSPVVLLDDAGQPLPTPYVTDAAGNYFFEVPPGTYIIQEVVPDGYTQLVPTAGSYTVTVGPGGIVSNQDFVNRPDPCCEARTEWLCDASGNRYIRLTVTNNGLITVNSITVMSLTSGVSASVAGMNPANPFPLLPGQSVVLNVFVTGLAPGASVDFQLDLGAEPDVFGMSENCCSRVIRFTRPGVTRPPGLADLCKFVVDGDVDVVDVVGPPRGRLSGWLVRARSTTGVVITAETDEDGYFIMEGLPMGQYTISTDLQFGFTAFEPVGGGYVVMLDDRNPYSTFRFGVTNDGSQTGLDPLAEGVPTEYTLDANYPNPFNPTTTIRYGLPESGPVRLEVFDMLGRPIMTLVDGDQAAGHHEVGFDARDLASGMYLYRISAGSFAATRRMVLMK